MYLPLAVCPDRGLPTAKEAETRGLYCRLVSEGVGLEVVGIFE